MSGFEVAGLVVGAFPLILQGVQSYRQGINKIRVLRKCASELDRLCRELQVEELEFQKACDQYDELYENGENADPYVASVFERTATHMKESVEELRVQLRIDLDPNSKVFPFRFRDRGLYV
jgi:hypothetical protein